MNRKIKNSMLGVNRPFRELSRVLPTPRRLGKVYPFGERCPHRFEGEPSRLHKKYRQPHAGRVTCNPEVNCCTQAITRFDCPVRGDSC